jgi:protein-L-isoaspartate(D-aspartate) O-methyltransferase
MDFSNLRDQMVQEQLICNGIKDQKILNAFLEVPRHMFVPQDLRSFAYKDRPIPLGPDQTISQPYIVAYMTQTLKLEEEYRVLEIGTGSGYQTAILSSLVREVYSVELVDSASKKANKVFLDLGYKNIHLKVGNGHEGWRKKAPFDSIILTAAPKKLPVALGDQLKMGGKIIAPIGEESDDQRLVLYEKMPDGGELDYKLLETNLLPVNFVRMKENISE